VREGEVGEMATATEKLVSIEQAARMFHVDSEWLRPLCIQAGIAVEWGSGTKRRRRKVDPADVDKLLLNRRAGPAAEAEKERRRQAGGKLNPRVRC
jgi:hypothetical protein